MQPVDFIRKWKAVGLTESGVESFLDELGCDELPLLI
jgi:hypothetical protein